MKIGIDLRPTQGHNKYRGIGRYINSVLLEIMLQDHKNDYIFYLTKDLKSSLEEISIPDHFKYKIVYIEPKSLSTKRIKAIFEKDNDTIELAKNEVDVFFQPDISFGLPKSVKTVTVFYDLIPLMFWNREKTKRFKPKKRIKVTIVEEILRAKYRRSLRLFKRADKIIAISQSSKNDIIHRYPSIKSNNVIVTYLGADTPKLLEGSNDINSTLKRLHIKKPFLLYVGAVDVRKNIIGMAKMFFELKSKGYKNLQLVMVGKEFTNKLELEELGWNDVVDKHIYKKDIILSGYIKDTDLEALYKQAAAFVFPSLYEGFGLPILEAMQEGCPVVAFSNSSIPEVAGSAAILAENEKEFVKGVEVLLQDENKRQDLIEAGCKQVKKFSWSKTAKQTLEVFGEVGLNNKV